MSDPPGVRASDDEREQLARQLREHYAAGRITEDELAERLDGVYAAKTVAELAALRTDLPDLPPPPAAQRAELAQRRSQLHRQLIQQTGGSLGLFAICVGIWAASGASGAFWPAFVLIFPILFFARNAWNLYGPSPQLDRVEAELRRERHRGPGPPRRRHRRDVGR